MASVSAPRVGAGRHGLLPSVTRTATAMVDGVPVFGNPDLDPELNADYRFHVSVATTDCPASTRLI